MPKTGGPRPNSGRPKKPLAQKLLEGNAGRRPLTVLKFENGGAPAAEIPEFLDVAGKEGGAVLPSAVEIYKSMSDFITRAGCRELVSDILIQDFAHLRRSYLECEQLNRERGRIANGKRSPYVFMALDYQKAALQVYTQIWNIISENCTENYGKKNSFIESLEQRGF